MALPRLMITALTATVLAACGNDPNSTPEPASRRGSDTQPPVSVFHNGNILTVDALFSTAQAFAIEGNRIIAVGSDAEVLEAAAVMR